MSAVALLKFTLQAVGCFALLAAVFIGACIYVANLEKEED